jgi:hypothetical protein
MAAHERPCTLIITGNIGFRDPGARKDGPGGMSDFDAANDFRRISRLVHLIISLSLRTIKARSMVWLTQIKAIDRRAA